MRSEVKLSRLNSLAYVLTVIYTESRVLYYVHLDDNQEQNGSNRKRSDFR